MLVSMYRFNISKLLEIFDVEGRKYCPCSLYPLRFSQGTLLQGWLSRLSILLKRFVSFPAAK